MTATTVLRKPTRRTSREVPRFYTLNDLAAITMTSLAYASEMSVKGEIPGRVEFGRAVRHDRDAVDAWLTAKLRGDAA